VGVLCVCVCVCVCASVWCVGVCTYFYILPTKIFRFLDYLLTISQLYFSKQIIHNYVNINVKTYNVVCIYTFPVDVNNYVAVLLVYFLLIKT